MKKNFNILLIEVLISIGPKNLELLQKNGTKENLISIIWIRVRISE
jgi:hypothetical protein